jgi:hypothetical protein
VNVGSDAWNLQVRDIAEAVAKEVPGTRVSINTAALPDRRSYRVDFSLYRQLAPQHQPRIGLADAVRGLRDGLAAIQFADAQFREGRYMRLKVLDALLAGGGLDADLRRVAPVAQQAVAA